MRHFRHKGCQTVMYIYIGPEHGPSRSLLSSEWRLGNGDEIEFGSSTVTKCPDCGARVNFKKRIDFEALDGKPFSPWAEPKIEINPRLWIQQALK